MKQTSNKFLPDSLSAYPFLPHKAKTSIRSGKSEIHSQQHICWRCKRYFWKEKFKIQSQQFKCWRCKRYFLLKKTSKIRSQQFTCWRCKRYFWWRKHPRSGHNSSHVGDVRDTFDTENTQDGDVRDQFDEENIQDPVTAVHLLEM